MNLFAMSVIYDLEAMEAAYGTRPATTYRAEMHELLIMLHGELAEFPEYIAEYTHHYNRYVKLYA